MNTVNRIIGSLLLGFSVAGGSTSPEIPPLETQCKDPRPKVCTMIYQPVCGLDKKGNFKTYSSGCNACSNPEVIGFNDQACKDVSDISKD